MEQAKCESLSNDAGELKLVDQCRIEQNLLVFYLPAQSSGKFDAEMITMTLKGKKGPEDFNVDEHPRPNVTKEQLQKLPPVFKKDGTVTAGNASVSFHV